MKKFARALALVSGLILLAGCDALTENWLPISAKHVPEVEATTVSGYVIDRAGNALADALVSNGASVAFTGQDGRFTLKEIRTGLQYITVNYDGVKSAPFQLEVRKTPIEIDSPLVIDTVRAVTKGLRAVNLLGISPTTLTATYSTEASASVPGGMIYGRPHYGEGGSQVTLSVATPPQASGLVIRSYRVEYEGNAAAPYSGNFSPAVLVGPGGVVESGPNRNVVIPSIALNTVAFATALDVSGSVTATITLYTEPHTVAQDATSSVRLHSPVKDKPDETRFFEAQVIIRKAED